MQQLNLNLKLVVYSDSTAGTNPKLKDLDYDRVMEGVSTDGLFTKRFSNVAPNTTVTVAATSRTLSQDTTTQWTVSLFEGSTYRYRWTGGTNPILRTARAIAADATTAWTVTVSGPVVRYTATAGTLPNTASVQVGDELLIETGSPFNTANIGIFTVLGKGAAYIEVSNETGAAEGPIVQSTLASGLPVVAVYSNGPVVSGDEVRVKATAFNIENRGTFKVIRVTANYFDVENQNPGYPEAITIGAADGLVFYPSLYRWIFVESDRRVSVRLNGDTTDNVEVEPVVEANPDKPGVMLLRGTVYSLVIANNGLLAANVKVALAE